MIPFIKAALAVRPDLRLWASPWCCLLYTSVYHDSAEHLIVYVAVQMFHQLSVGESGVDVYKRQDENWEKAERAIVEACEEKGLNARVELGEAAFYGPKLDFMVKMCIRDRYKSCNRQHGAYLFSRLFPKLLLHR